MQTNQPFLDNLWRWKCGLKEKSTSLKKKETVTDVTDLLKTNWSEKFIQLMKNRMMLGFFRYGPVKNNSVKYNNIESAIKRLRNYQSKGNQEDLVDTANLCLIEFIQENHPNTHFESVDDGEHTEQIV